MTRRLVHRRLGPPKGSEPAVPVTLYVRPSDASALYALLQALPPGDERHARALGVAQQLLHGLGRPLPAPARDA